MKNALFPDLPSDRELEARRLSGALANALQAAVDFCKATPSDIPSFKAEGALAECLRQLNPEPGLPAWAVDCEDLEYEPSDISLIERLRKYSVSPFAEGKTRASLIEATERPWRLRLPEHLAEKLLAPLKASRKAHNDLGITEDEFADMEAWVGPLESVEIAWASILLGNFPDITASEMRHGVTISEAIEQEARAIRSARRRRHAELKERLAGQDMQYQDDAPP